MLPQNSNEPFLQVLLCSFCYTSSDCNLDSHSTSQIFARYHRIQMSLFYMSYYVHFVTLVAIAIWFLIRLYKSLHATTEFKWAFSTSYYVHFVTLVAIAIWILIWLHKSLHATTEFKWAFFTHPAIQFISAVDKFHYLSPRRWSAGVYLVISMKTASPSSKPACTTKSGTNWLGRSVLLGWRLCHLPMLGRTVQERG